jgi:hypothetical protein
MMNVGMRSFYLIGVFGEVRPLPSPAQMRPLVLPITLLALASAAADAHAATVSTDRACYLETRSTNVTVTGAGFGASRPYTVALDGSPLPGGGAATDANGAMQGTISPPPLTDAQQERTFTVGVESDGVGANSSFTVTKFSADFTPSAHVSPNSRVRFSVYGFALSSPSPDVYLHYVDPAGKLRGTIRLGRAQGQCGRIERTARRKLFPFGKPRRGKWLLQFDTARTYTRGMKGSPFLFYTIGVNVRAAKRTSRHGSAGSLGPGALAVDGSR